MKTYKNPLTIIKSKSPEPFVPTPSLVYTLSSDGTYYIVGTGFTTIESIQSDTSGGVKGSGLDNTWQGGELNIPATHNNLPVKGIAPRAFAQITNITKLMIEDGEMITIGHRAFQTASDNGGEDTNLKEITLPNTLKSLGDSQSRVFWGRRGLETINYRCINFTEEKAFDNYTNFMYCGSETLNGITINISKDVQQIQKGAFRGWETYVKEVNFEEGSICSTINDFAFWNMTTKDISSPTKITFPPTITNILGIPFGSNNPYNFIFKLYMVNPPSIKAGAMGSGQNITKIYVPAESVEAYKTATNWSNYAPKIEAISG